MKRRYSVQITINYSSGPSCRQEAFSSPLPFEATPDEALQTMIDFRSKIMSLCVGGPWAPLLCYGRRVWKAEDTTYLEDEVLIPSAVLRENIISIKLIAHTEKK